MQDEGISRELRDAFPGFVDPEDTQPRHDRYWTLPVDDPSPPAKRRSDHRASGNLTTPRDQGGCNTCTSFAVVAAVEAGHALAGSGTVRLAPGFIHSCLLGRACATGVTAENAIDAAISKGIARSFAGDYPYPPDRCGTEDRLRISGKTWLAGPNAGIRAVMAAPVVADMWIDPGFLKLRRNDVYRCPPGGSRRLHSVCVVGFDQDAGYWIVQNSFGVGWADHGFGLVAFGSGDLLAARGGWRILL